MVLVPCVLLPFLGQNRGDRVRMYIAERLLRLLLAVIRKPIEILIELAYFVVRFGANHDHNMFIW